MYEYNYPDPNLARIHDQYIDEYAEGTPESRNEDPPPWVDDYEHPETEVKDA